MLKLRYHHGLCLLNFVGKGYDEKFVENLQQIKNRKDTIQWISECDEICQMCPRKLESHCQSDLPDILDQRVKDYFINPTHSDLVYLNQYKFKEICEGCEWHDFCEEIRKR